MMRWIVGSSLKFRRLIIAVAAGLLVFGVLQLDQMRKDILPEFSKPTVEVQTEALGLSAEEVEQLITVPLEQDLLNGVAFLEEIESVSMPGLSSVVMTFEPGTDLLDARQVVAERLTQAVGVAGLPQVAKLPQMIQPLSSTSRVGMVKLSSDETSTIGMSVLAKWKIVPRLMGVEGVANVAIWGFRDQQLQVLVDPARLGEEDVTLNQIIRTTGNALEVSPLSFLPSSSPGTGGFIDTVNQRLHIFHEQAISSPEELAQVPIEGPDGEVIASAGGAPLALGDVADVVENHQPLIGDALCSDGACLLLVVEKFPGANTPEVAAGVDEALQTLAPGMAGIEVDTSIYRPAVFIESSVDNLGRALAIGGILLLLVLGAFFFSWRSAIVAALAIASSLVAGWLVLYFSGTTVNTMILAGLVAGLVVLIDDAIMDVHNVSRRVRQHKTDGDGTPMWRVVVDAAMEMRTSALYASLIVAAVLIPAFFMQAEAGAFLPPAAIAYLLATVASILVALTVTPALSMMLLAGEPANRPDSPVVRSIRRGYDRIAPSIVPRPAAAVAVLSVMLVVGLVAFPFLDRSYRPTPLERDIQVQITAPAGTSLTRMDEITAKAVDDLSTLSGVENVGAHVGRAVSSDQVVNVNSAEVWVNIGESADYDDTLAAIEGVSRDLPDVSADVLTYSEQRVTDLLGGVQDEIVVRIYGENPQVLEDKADEIQGVIGGIAGIEDATVQRTADEPTIEIEADIERAREFGIKPGDVRRTSATLLSGLTVGNLFDDQKVFDVVVWGTPQIRQTTDDVEEMLIDVPGGGQVRLGDVANMRVVPNPTVIRHESVGTYMDVTAGVDGRSVGDVSADVDSALEQVEFPFEHHAELLGGFADEQAARTRVIGIAIAAAIGIFLLLQAAFMSWRLAILAFLTLPAALAGGAVAALLSGGAITLGSVIGFVAVLALAVRASIVLIRHLQQLQRDGDTFGLELVTRGTGERVGAIVATAISVVAVFAPLVFGGNAAGFEIVRPMAIVVLGGLVSSTLLTLVVLPAAYLRYGFVAEPDLSAEDIDLVTLPDVDPVRN